MSEEWILQFGYVGLFVLSFLAATIIPFSTEFAVLVMPTLGFNPWAVMGVATVGNFLGSMTGYLAGLYGRNFVFFRFFHVDPQRVERAQRWFRKWGSPVLFMSWAPFIGDLLPIVAGMLAMSGWIVAFWVFLGKWLRYVALLGIAGFLT